MLTKSIIIPSLIILSVIGFVFVASSFTVPSTTLTTTSQNVGDSATIHYTGIVCVGINQIAEKGQCRHNLFTEAGKNITRDLLEGQSFSGMQNITGIGLGNGTGATSTGLNMTNGTGGANMPITDCGLGPSNATYSPVTANCQNGGCSGNWSLTKTFTSTCAGPNYVNQTALYNDTNTQSKFNSSSYFAANNFSMAGLNNGDQINITWFIWLQ